MKIKTSYVVFAVAAFILMVLLNLLTHNLFWGILGGWHFGCNLHKYYETIFSEEPFEFKD